MRHTIHIMYGAEFKKTLLYLKEYLDRSSTPEISDYCSVFLLEKNEQSIELYEAKVEKVDFPSITKRENYITEKVSKATIENQGDMLLEFFRKQARTRITQDKPGDYSQLNVIIHCPLYLASAFDDILPLLSAVTEFHLDIDILGFDQDLKEVFVAPEDEVTCENLEDNVNKNIMYFIGYAEKNPDVLKHILVWSNFIYTGISLNISDIKSFVRVVGEFSLLCVENYDSVFGSIQRESIVYTFGVSMLNFDRFYFVEYMANRTYMSVMDSENINQESASINKISSRSKKILEPLLAYFSDFYNKEVKQRIDTKFEASNKKLRRDKNKSEIYKTIFEEVVNEVEPIIDLKIEEMKNTLIEYFDDKKNDEVMSLPEKKALLSTILGDDDELLVNNTYNNSPIIFDDIEGHFLEFFIKLNNSIIENSETYPDIKESAVLSLKGEVVDCNLELIKKLKLIIKKKSSYIRELESEKERYKNQISNQKESRKTLIKDGTFIFNDQEFKLLPVEIEEKPLQETYVAHQVDAKSIDLRGSFPQINNQGQQGACTAFALTSIYEYFFNRDNKKDCKLSQAFLYYNARKKNGDEGKDVGSAVSYAIETMTENGMCLNSVFPYSDKDYQTVPSQEAYEDGATRKVRKAFNVNNTLGDIKSVLSDGYPVAFSTTLYGSFGSGYKGFISMPTKEEIEQDKKNESHGYHAMVICGYNDESKYFVVRNSWGTSFGDMGYCYMPYEYVLDKRLTLGLYVITEIALCEIAVLQKDKRHVVEFDVRDSELMFHITERYIENEISEQNVLQSKLDVLILSYNRLKQSIKDYVNQDILRDGYSNLLDLEHAKFLKEKQIKEVERDEALASISRVKPIGIAFGVCFILALVGWWLLPLLNDLPKDLYDGHFHGGFSDALIWSLSWIVIFAICFAVINNSYNKKRRAIKERFDSILIKLAKTIGSLEREKLILPLRVQVYSTMLTKINIVKDKLHTTLYRTKSYLENLRGWYAEMQEERKEMNPSTRQPFTSLLSNEKLDEYFELHRDEISKGISLSKYILNEYKLSEDDIIEFKLNLDREIETKIQSFYSDFRMDDYLMGKRYDYLEDLDGDGTILLEDLDERNKLFYPSKKFQEGLQPSRVIYIDVQEKDSRRWNETYSAAFAIKPGYVQLGSVYKLVLLTLQDINLNKLK